jgi:RNA polymerase sigma factor (sigma-70 family)
MHLFGHEDHAHASFADLFQQLVLPDVAQMVRLRFFGGLSTEEVAEALGVSPSTVKRDWTFARAWLLRELSGESK